MLRLLRQNVEVAVVIVAENYGLGGAGCAVAQAGHGSVSPLLQRSASQRVRSRRSPSGRFEGDEPDAEQTFRPAGSKHHPELRLAAPRRARLR